MLTLKLISEETERVVGVSKKKHFPNARGDRRESFGVRQDSS